MSDSRSPDDQELLQRIARRDETALALLYQRYGAQVYSLTYQVLRNSQLAEEATQDTFMKVWRLSHSWDPEKGRFISWLMTVARHTAIDRLRQEERQSALNNASIDEIAPITTDRGLPHDPALQDGRLLRQLLQQLPQEQAQAIEMAFFQGLTHSSLAEKLNLPLGTVKTRVRLGLQKLKTLWVEATATQESPEP